MSTAVLFTFYSAWIVRQDPPKENFCGGELFSRQEEAEERRDYLNDLYISSIASDPDFPEYKVYELKVVRNEDIERLRRK